MPQFQHPARSFVGTSIADRYELIDLVGQGGMGAVYEARQIHTGKRCALKLLMSPDLLTNPDNVARFYREARACAAIESEHIVQVFDSGTDPASGLPFMVMELLRGEDLEAVHDRTGPMVPDAVVKLMIQACIGLGKAHDAGIVHRDIKLANLFLSSRETGGLVVKLLDFGIAKVKMENFAQSVSGAHHALTRTGSMLGTPLYMSPEQARGASKVDPRSDVWSLGMAMYNLLAGRLPFEDVTSLGDLFVLLITGVIPPLQDHAPWVAPELAEVVHTALARDPATRYRDASELREALVRLSPEGAVLTPDALRPVPDNMRQQTAPRLEPAGALASTAARSGLSVTNAAPSPRSPLRHVTWVAASLALVALAAGGILLWRARTHTVTAPQATVTSDSASHAAASAAPASPPSASLPLPLLVAPDDAEVFIDGVRAEVKDGAVLLSGAPGSTRRVKVVARGHQAEQEVAITQAGLLPSKVELPLPAAAPAPGKAPAKVGAAAKPGGSGASKPAAAAPPAPAGQPKVSTDTSEF